MSNLTLARDGETDIIATRRFKASPEALYRAHTDPELIRQWVLGPPGWSMTVCVNEARPGGRIHYEWQHEDGHRFGITGEMLEIESGARIVHSERMELGDATAEYRVETCFEADGEGALLTLRMIFPDEATRETMIETGMEHGIEASYARVDPLLTSPGGQ
ncbi:MAG: hypothetical protein F4179_13260 [Gammaproteobacteria bacterium]|nr:hypothetical protein [Gammaproteobacteria bacterium]MYF62609.1 hypothetical protein [Gammaproteobacteria bacterium]MYI21559.1 hypothetical protein [Gammaproteobacteria bacterium]